MRGKLRLRAGSKSGDESPHSKKAPIPICFTNSYETSNLKVEL